jgi:hypothetical protein
MKASVLHDEHGRILGISKETDLRAAGSKFTSFGMIPGKGQLLAQVELTGDEATRPLRELHERFKVDTASRRLVEKR